MKIICIGRNYAEHAKELGNKVPDKPVIFLKPDSALIPKGHPFFYPTFTKDLHFEVEIVIRINKVGKNIEERFAHKYYNEIGIGIDFTARDLQQKCKDNGHPWEIAKAFDFSAPLSKKFLPLSNFTSVQDINFSLKKNGAIVQMDNTKNMVFSVDRIIKEVSEIFILKTGDLIFTGTPKGVGPVQIGDKLEAFIGEESLLELNVR
ncbi:MAG: acylpyruvate hydrolase [Patiriisocius sp.]|jgi:acylpyruvate hydrolase